MDRLFPSAVLEVRNLILRLPTFVRSIALAILCCTILASCGSPPALVPADGAVTRTGPDGASDAEGGACPAPTFLSPCRVDSDCQNPYLVCERPGGVIVCRDPQANPACPSLVDMTNVPACPTTEPAPYPVCTISYQLPCTVDTDCGPVFTCTRGRCQSAPTGTKCSTAADCPTAWDCYTPCASSPCIAATKVCEPPFAVFNCPACAPTP
jgi:hypothetical protein